MTEFVIRRRRIGDVETPTIIRNALRKSKTFGLFAMMMAQIGLGVDDSRYWWDRSREPADEDIKGEK